MTQWSVNRLEHLFQHYFKLMTKAPNKRYQIFLDMLCQPGFSSNFRSNVRQLKTNFSKTVSSKFPKTQSVSVFYQSRDILLSVRQQLQRIQELPWFQWWIVSWPVISYINNIHICKPFLSSTFPQRYSEMQKKFWHDLSFIFVCHSIFNTI